MRVFLLALAILIEIGLANLSHWQYRRYQSALAENAQPRPAITLVGSFIPTATTVLDNQPNPQEPSRIGWRLLVPFKTEAETLLIDRGWLPLPPDRTQFPPELLTQTSASPTTLTATLQAFKKEKGWLKGPLTATHPRILTRMHPAPIPVEVSTANFAYELSENTQLPPLRNPQMHQSYMLQWLGLAIAFPLMILRLFKGVWKIR